jgi:hypothetical protein
MIDRWLGRDRNRLKSRVYGVQGEGLVTFGEGPLFSSLFLFLVRSGTYFAIGVPRGSVRMFYYLPCTLVFQSPKDGRSCVAAVQTPGSSFRHNSAGSGCHTQ